MEFVLGSLFVSVYAIKRFKKYDNNDFPPPPRHSTKAYRYYRSVVLYVAFAVLMFLTLAFVPAAVLMATFAAPWAQTAWSTLPPVVVAVGLLTLLLPKSPMLREVDASIQDGLRNLAHIPWMAREIRTWILDAKHSPDPLRAQGQHRSARRQALATAAQALLGSAKSDKQRHAGKSLVRAWYLLYSIDTDAAFAQFATVSKQIINKYETRLDALTDDLETLSTITPPDTNGENTLVDEAEALDKDVAGFFAQALLKARLSDRASEDKLKRLRFTSDQPWPCDSRDITDLMSLVGIIVFVVLLIALILLASSEGNPGVKALMIALVYTAAFGVPAVFVHNRVRAGEPMHKNIDTYVLAVVLAIVIDLAIRWVFKLLIFAVDKHSLAIGAAVAWSDLAQKWGYSILTLTNSCVTALILDRTDVKRVASLWYRCAEGAVYAIFNVAAGLLVWEVLGNGGRPKGLEEWEFLLIATGLGFVLGFLIPSMFRDRMRGTILAADEKGRAKAEGGREIRLSASSDNLQAHALSASVGTDRTHDGGVPTFINAAQEGINPDGPDIVVSVRKPSGVAVEKAEDWPPVEP